MREQKFTYDRYKWNIKVFYDVSCSDSTAIVYELTEIGCSGENLYRAQQNIDSCNKNCGITFANINSREMVVVITETTSCKEFLNTVVHELHHMAEFIARADRIPQTGEEISYIAGDLSSLMFDEISKKICPHCSKNK